MNYQQIKRAIIMFKFIINSTKIHINKQTYSFTRYI